jgi:hypothetical protein
MQVSCSTSRDTHSTYCLVLFTISQWPISHNHSLDLSCFCHVINIYFFVISKIFCKIMFLFVCETNVYLSSLFLSVSYFSKIFH